MLPGGGTVLAFCVRILALGRWNLQMSWCKCPGVPRGEPPGIAAGKCIRWTAYVQRKLVSVGIFKNKEPSKQPLV